MSSFLQPPLHDALTIENKSRVRRRACMCMWTCVYVYACVCWGLQFSQTKGALTQIQSAPPPIFEEACLYSVVLFWIVPLTEEAVRTLLYEEFVSSQRNTRVLKDKPCCCRSFIPTVTVSPDSQPGGGQSLCVAQKMSLHLIMKTVTTWFIMESCLLCDLAFKKTPAAAVSTQHFNSCMASISPAGGKRAWQGWKIAVRDRDNRARRCLWCLWNDELLWGFLSRQFVL